MINGRKKDRKQKTKKDKMYAMIHLQITEYYWFPFLFNWPLFRELFQLRQCV